jgi:sRNA-binding protein
VFEFVPLSDFGYSLISINVYNGGVYEGWNMRTDDAIEVIRTLAERWPKTFYPESKKRKPLKVGIFQDLKVAAPDIEPKMLRLALRVYTTSGAYLFACSEGYKRVDLNGNAVEEVSEKDKARAREILEARKKKGARAEAQEAEAERLKDKEEARRPVPRGVNARKPVLRSKV